MGRSWDYAFATFFDAALLAVALLAFATAGFPAFFAALNAAQRFLVASIILFLPAALSSRFGFDASDATGCGSDLCLIAAHLFRCASAIFRRAAGLTFRLGRAVSESAAETVRLPSNMRRISVI